MIQMGIGVWLKTKGEHNIIVTLTGELVTIVTLIASKIRMLQAIAIVTLIVSNIAMLQLRTTVWTKMKRNENHDSNVLNQQ